MGSWAWAVRPIIAALERLKQEDPQEFKVSLEYIARPCLRILKWKKKKKKKTKGKRGWSEGQSPGIRNCVYQKVSGTQ